MNVSVPRRNQLAQYLDSFFMIHHQFGVDVSYLDS